MLQFSDDSLGTKRSSVGCRTSPEADLRLRVEPEIDLNRIWIININMYLWKKSRDIHVRKYHIIWAFSIFWNDVQEMRKNPICRPVFNLYQNSISKHAMSYRNTCMKWNRYRSIVWFSWIRRVNNESVPFRLLWGHGTKRHSKCKISKNLILVVITKICMHVGRGRGSFCLSINPPPPHFNFF